MAKHYSRRSFLRSAPNEMLKRYFRGSDLLQDFAFDGLTARKIEPLFDAIEDFDDDARKQIDRDFEQISLLADSTGRKVIIDMVGRQAATELSVVQAMETSCEVAFWLFLHHSGNSGMLFEQCARVGLTRRLRWSNARLRSGLPQQAPAFDEKARHVLASAISGYYRAQGRGRRCVVEHYLRPDPERHIFLAYPQDYPTSELIYRAEHGEEPDTLSALSAETRQGVFIVAFRFQPASGSLRVSNPGDTDAAQALMEMFAQHALGMEELPPKTVLEVDLDRLLDPHFDFATDPDDAIAKVRISDLRLTHKSDRKHRVRVESRNWDDPTDFQQWLHDAIDLRAIPRHQWQVGQAVLRVWFSDDAGGEGAHIDVRLTRPRSCNLGDEPQSLLVMKYLRLWKLVA